MLREEGLRVSIVSVDPLEVEAALAAGAELVLSVNSSNVDQTRGWQERSNLVGRVEALRDPPSATGGSRKASTRPTREFEVVAIPDTPSDLDSLARTVE